MKKPDGDNLEKYLNDCFTGLLWKDDAQIAWMVRSKSWTESKEGETYIFLRELPVGPQPYDLILTDICEHLKVDGHENSEE